MVVISTWPLGSSPRSADVVERLIHGLTATFLPGLEAQA